MQGRETAVLRCHSCGLEAEHTLDYAGRLLVSTTCNHCGITTHHEDPDLRHAYAQDLTQRVRTKPRRWLRRLRQDPVRTALELPRAIITQPLKIVREVLTISRG